MRMLSYADRTRILAALLLLAALAASSWVVYQRSYNLASTYVEAGKEYVSDEIYYVDSARRILQNVFKVELDYWEYSGKTKEDYYNLEHPPLGKYIIALSMLTCGDKPICWRLPGIIEASLIPVIVALAYTRLDNRWLLAASSAALAAGSDYILHTAGAVAMLDIHLAFFTALTLLAAARGRLVLAAFLAGAAASVKMSGVAAAIALIVYVLYDKDISVRARIKRIAGIILAAVSVYILVYAPLATYFGPVELVKENINALKWHTTSRPSGPPTSTPTGWIFNVNPFYYSVSQVLVPARLNTLIHFPALVASLLIVIYYIEGGRRRHVFSSILYLSIILTYFLVFALGNRTLYSFYGVHLTPAAAGVIAEVALFAGGYGKSKTLEEGNGVVGGLDEAGGAVREAGAEDAGSGAAEGGS